MGMKWFIRIAILSLAVCTYPCEAADDTVPHMGAFGAGIFIPTGADADVARTSPILQLTANIMFLPRLGLDVEFQYIPVLLDDTALNTAAHRKATQLSLVGGFRATSSSLPSSVLIGYVAARVGFARIATRANYAAFPGGWIGRSVGSLQNPNTGLGFTAKVRQKGLVISPKAGAILPIANRTVIDIALSPMFIFDSGDVTAQYHITLSFGRINR